MKRNRVLAVWLIALPVLAADAVAQGAADKARVDRCKYLVWAGGGNDCRTPKKMGPKGPELDTARLLSAADRAPRPA